MASRRCVCRTRARVPLWPRVLALPRYFHAQVALAPACNHALFVTADGELWVVGNTEDGQAGVELKGPADKNKELTVPRRVTGLLEDKRVVHAAVAQSKSACVTEDGELYTWGMEGGWGELGWGSRKGGLRVAGLRKKVPCLVALPSGGDAPTAAAGGATAAGAAAALAAAKLVGTFFDAPAPKQRSAEAKGSDADKFRAEVANFQVRGGELDEGRGDHLASTLPGAAARGARAATLSHHASAPSPLAVLAAAARVPRGGPRRGDAPRRHAAAARGPARAAGCGCGRGPSRGCCGPSC